MSEKEYVYSTYSDGPFDYDNEEEAVDAELSNYTYGIDGMPSIYRGEKVPQQAKKFIYGCDIVDGIQTHAEEDMGEYADGWLTALTANSELLADLETHIDNWFTAHGLQPTFYQVGNIEELEVTITITKVK